MKETIELLTMWDVMNSDDEREAIAWNGLSDEDYQQGRAMAAVLLLLDDLQRTKSLDTSQLQDLAAEVVLWG
jgi:hypothetical protein